MKRNLKITLIVILFVFVLFLFFYKYKIDKPYRIVKDISDLTITRNSTLYKYDKFVDNFDGSSIMEVRFSIGNKDMEELKEQTKKEKFKIPPVRGFKFGDEIENYLLPKDSVYYKLEGEDIMDYSLTVVNFTQRKLIIKKVQTYK